jgi:hypothetical protein
LNLAWYTLLIIFSRLDQNLAYTNETINIVAKYDTNFFDGQVNEPGKYFEEGVLKHKPEENNKGCQNLFER